MLIARELVPARLVSTERRHPGLHVRDNGTCAPKLRSRRAFFDVHPANGMIRNYALVDTMLLVPVLALADRDVGATTQGRVDHLGAIERGVGSQQRPLVSAGQQLRIPFGVVGPRSPARSGSCSRRRAVR
jgi:hypothetical protein